MVNFEQVNSSWDRLKIPVEVTDTDFVTESLLDYIFIIHVYNSSFKNTHLKCFILFFQLFQL